MTELKADVLVLGAGMVGVGAALHLQRRGRDVILVDRHELAGEETSFGNAGMIESASVFPYMFPRDFAQILQYALNRAPQVRYALSDLPSILPWLVRYYLDAAAIAAREPNLTGEFAGAIYLPAPGFVPDPGGLAKAYAALFKRKSGRFFVGDARSLEQVGAGWRVAGSDGAAVAREVVVALGPWSDLVFGPLGYSIPLAVKRGYHLHLAPRGNAVLHHPVLDADLGYMLSPMNRGIRLATGVEFARRDAPPTPIQLQRSLPRARALFPLGEAVDAKPWIGARPCLPDMLPVIGKAPSHSGLWFNFGHQHHGLTLGPVTGRLLAEMMTGETPFADPGPFGVERFG